MKTLSQQELLENFAAQERNTKIDLNHADLSDISWDGVDVGGKTIAMSILRNAHFTARQPLQGCTWIGNDIDGCTFASVKAAKCEFLDCRFQGCTFDAIELFRSDLSRTVFSCCRFDHVNFSKATMLRVHFDDCTFSDTQLTADFAFTGTASFLFTAEEQLASGAALSSEG